MDLLISFMTQFGGGKKFESSVESIKSALKSGRPKFASRKEIVSKIKKKSLKEMPDLCMGNSCSPCCRW